MKTDTDTRKEAILSLDNETISYKGVAALKEVSLHINAGEKVALIGKSGAGKTTLLRRLYQLLPDQCAFIHQHYSLVPQLTVFHNIYMGRLDRYSVFHNVRNLVRPAKIRLDQVEQISSSLGLREKMHTRVGELSGGQQQRVGIGRAFYRGGSVLMADEPVSSLDRVQREQIMSIITRTDKTVVSTLHAIDLSRQFFNRIVGLKDQQILFDLPVQQVSDDLLEALYA